MIYAKKKFLIGGTSNIKLKKEIEKYSTWFGVKTLAMIDDVIMMINHMRYSNDANEILDYILNGHNFDRMPIPCESGATNPVPPLRIYYLLFKCQGRVDKAKGLCDKIEVGENFIDVKESHGEQGDNG